MKITNSWSNYLYEDMQKLYYIKLKAFLKSEIQRGATIYPPSKLVFNAYNLVPFEKVRIVLCGQDPYSSYGQAVGLAFSVPEQYAIPPSLMNIFKEIYDGEDLPRHGDLTSWAEQGVLLLNSVLTVREHQPRSHYDRGWELFTDATIKILSDKKEGLIFYMLGAKAKEKIKLIDMNKHVVLSSPHPAARDGQFTGTGHFSYINKILELSNEQQIKWRI